MRIAFNNGGEVITRRERESLIRRAQALFARFGRSVKRVEIRVTDENGPKGGTDKRSVVRLESPGLRAIAADATDSDGRRAAARALKRAQRSLMRRLDLRRERVRR